MSNKEHLVTSKCNVMKQKLFAIAFAAMLAACGGKSKTDTAAVDTANRSSLDQSAAIQMNGVGDTLVGADGNKYVKVAPNNAAATAPIVVQPTPGTTTTITTKPTGTHSTGSSTGGRTYSSGGSSSGTYASTGTGQTQTKKKGWSKAAKGAVIGGATGAVAGAIISKKKGTGALVGGLLGAGAGYVIGRSKDKKDGRVQ